MPYTPPPVYQPPTVYEGQQQEQQQEQTTIGELLQEQISESESKSASDSSSSNSSVQSNVQINNSSNRIEWGSFKVPETSISISAYGNRSDHGVIATVNIPVGGRARRRINRAIEKEVAILDLQYASQYYSACTSIQDKGIVIVADENFANELEHCGTRIARNIPAPAPAPTGNSELDILKAELAQLRQQNQLLLQELQRRPRKGGF